MAPNSSKARGGRDDEDAKTIPHEEPVGVSRPPEEKEGLLRRFLDLLGPGLITGASDDDPSGIGTYATAGASLGFATLWTAIVTLPLMASVQFVCAKTINAGTDIGAIAASITLLVPVPAVWLVVPVAVAIVALQVWGSYRLIANVFKWLTFTLFAYVGAAFLARPDWGEVLRSTFVPHISFSGKYLLTLVAILGTTISPYLFFWQASE